MSKRVFGLGAPRPGTAAKRPGQRPTAPMGGRFVAASALEQPFSGARPHKVLMVTGAAPTRSRALPSGAGGMSKRVFGLGAPRPGTAAKRPGQRPTAPKGGRLVTTCAPEHRSAGCPHKARTVAVGAPTRGRALPSGAWRSGRFGWAKSRRSRRLWGLPGSAGSSSACQLACQGAAPSAARRRS